MTQTFRCAQCQEEFTVDCPDNDADCLATLKLFEEVHAVCDDCEHKYLAWAGCHAAL
jgi:hypothetical protein